MNILILSSIFQSTIETLSKDHHVICKFNADEKQLKKIIHDREVIIFRSGVSITAPVLEQASKLKLIIRAGSGMENIDMQYVAERGIIFRRIPEPSAKSVSELAFGLMITLARNILTVDRLLRKGQWAKHDFTGYLLYGKTLGILGLGNIGSRVGQLGLALGMNVIGYDPAFIANQQKPKNGTDAEIRVKEFEEVISESDFLTIHVPLNKRTRNMINEAVIARMKKDSFLLNLARGGVVNETALFKALKKKSPLLGAALDVHENEGNGYVPSLASLPNVVLTPHIGSQTIDTQHEIGQRVLQIIDNFPLN